MTLLKLAYIIDTSLFTFTEQIQLIHIQLFRQRLSHKTYAYATTPSDSDSLLLFYLRARCFSKKGRPGEGGMQTHVLMRTCVCAVSSIMLKHLAASIKTLKARITHDNFRHCRIRLYTFVGQPFSKQLYVGKRYHLCTDIALQSICHTVYYVSQSAKS